LQGRVGVGTRLDGEALARVVVPTTPYAKLRARCKCSEHTRTCARTRAHAGCASGPCAFVCDIDAAAGAGPRVCSTPSAPSTIMVIYVLAVLGRLLKGKVVLDDLAADGRAAVQVVEVAVVGRVVEDRVALGGRARR
jgi:hypothetical protein